MAALIFVLSFLLLVAGAAGGYMSIDLLPTAPGLLYAFAGAVSVVGAILVFALGVLVARVGRLTRALAEQAAGAWAPEPTPELVEESGALSPELEAIEPGAAAADVEAAPEPEFAPEPEPEPEATDGEAATGAQGEPAEGEAASEEPLNENRAGRLPTLEAIEKALETPEPPPTLIGRYASGGANYMIFSDGSIEAETDDGAYKFASMGDFKQFLLERNAGKP